MKFTITLFAVLIAAITNAQMLTVESDAVKIKFVADMKGTEGKIGGFKASIRFDLNDLAQSSIEGTVDVNTLDTGIPARNKHLKSDDFFDANKFPTMSFKSISIKEDAEGYLMIGIMKIKNKEREESIRFIFSENVFKAECTIQAANYNFGYENKKPEKTNVRISFVVPVN